MRRYREKLRPTPQKKLLALDGGGIRGVITLEVLARIEAILREEKAGEARILDWQTTSTTSPAPVPGPSLPLPCRSA